jgi:hypothetical protein
MSTSPLEPLACIWNLDFDLDAATNTTLSNHIITTNLKS